MSIIFTLLSTETPSAADNIKGDPCDPGFNELADKFGDTYGPHDVVKMEDYFIRATINNIKVLPICNTR